MREYGRIATAFWASADMRALSDDGRMLAMYLMTNPHSTQAGVCRLPDGYVCDDIQWPSGRVAAAFAELAAIGFAHRCSTTAWVWIVKHLAWNPPENPNQWKAVRRSAACIPAACLWRSRFDAENADWLQPEKHPPDPGKKPIETPAPGKDASAGGSDIQTAEGDVQQPVSSSAHKEQTVSEQFANGFETTKPKQKQKQNPNTPPHPPDRGASAHGADGAAGRGGGGLTLVQGRKPGVPDCPQADLLALYAKHLPMLRQPIRWDGERAAAMRHRWVEWSAPSAVGDGYTTVADGLEFWARFFAYVAATPKLSAGIPSPGADGQVSVWRPDLPWLLDAENFIKVVEGKYT